MFSTGKQGSCTQGTQNIDYNKFTSPETLEENEEKRVRKRESFISVSKLTWARHMFVINFKYKL